MLGSATQIFHPRTLGPMNTMIKRTLLTLLLSSVCGCQSAYYGAMEKVGFHKRDILVDRVEAARDSQTEAKEQFVSAVAKFKSVVHFEGGDLEKRYDELSAVLKKSEAEAETVHERVAAVEDVSQALFDEWKGEIKTYSSDNLRRSSQQKYDAAKKKYDIMIAAMKKADSRLEPALVPLRDQVLFLKHNLNARAIAGLSDELVTVETNVDALVADMERSISAADHFIAELQAGEGS